MVLESRPHDLDEARVALARALLQAFTLGLLEP